MAVKLRLHARALAKSNRPYALLETHALPVVAVDRIGELIVAGTPARLRSLSSAVATVSTKKDLYAISTIVTISRWDSAKDVFRADSDAEAESIVGEAIRHEKHIKVTFFPWMARNAPENRQSALSAPASASPSSAMELAREYLHDLDLHVESAEVASTRPVIYVRPTQETSAEQLASIPGVRTVSLAPTYRATDETTPQFYSPIRALGQTDLGPTSNDAPVVGVLDTGVNSSFLEPGVSGRARFVAGAELDEGHGTFVAGLVTDSLRLNDSSDLYPADSSRIYDAQVMPGTGISEALLHERVAEVLADPETAEIKVWNCSFGSRPVGDPDYGTFAQELDAISSERGVLFVIAAGNYEDQPTRAWPPSAGVVLEDRISSPAESVRSLTVGARAHKGGAVAVGKPASYTRRGPSFAAHVKPEVCHWGGDVGPDRSLAGFGVQSVVPSGELAESVGTSFAAPIVSTIAANTWQTLEASGAVSEVRPELIKGLMIHSAALSDESTEKKYRDYYGWGVPTGSSQVLGNTQESFTTVHEVILTPGTNWYKDPFPVPDCLLLQGNKFQGEVVLTLSYSPPIDAAFGAEAVRYDVAGSFGSFKRDPSGKLKFKSITPGEKPPSDLWEANQIAEGKWAPTKTYRHRSPQGVTGGDWALRLSLTERVSNEVQREQLVYAIVTFRSLEEGRPVYQNGVDAVARLGYENRTMVRTDRLRV